MLKAVGHIGKTVVPMQSTFKQMERIIQAGTGKAGKYGEEYNLKDELPGLWGFRAVQSNPERSLQFKLGKFGSSLKKTENLFTSSLLKGGRITSKDILDTYQYSESRRFQVLKEMAKDIDAMRELGMNEYLNRKEGLNLPNPYFEAQPFINEIINKNNRINLLEGDISFSQLGAQLPQVRSAPVTQQTGINPTAINPNNFTQQANNNYSSLTSLEKDRLLFNNR